MKNQKIIIIVAMGRNNEIGRDNHLLWSLPNDMKRFKSLTTGHTVVMGYNTFKSLPKGKLPNRRNIIMTTHDIAIDGCEVAHSVEQVLAMTQDDGEVYIIGGGEVYRQFLPIADVLMVTHVDDSQPADRYFPVIDGKLWHITDDEAFAADERHAVAYRFVRYER